MQELLEEFRILQNHIHDDYQDAPNTTDSAVKKAGKAINENSDGTFTDEEIDSILPDALKRNVHPSST